MSWDDDDFEYRDGKEYDPELCDGVTIFSNITNELQYGRQLDEIGKLRMLDRQLYQEQDFYFVGTKVFKKVDPIDQAMDGDVGHDIAGADPEVVKEWEQKLASLVDPDYDDAMNYIVEQPLEDCHVYADVRDETECLRVISIDFLSLTGNFVALGYTPPKDKYKFIGNFAPNESQRIAKERKELFSYLCSDIRHTENLKELNQIIVDIRVDYQHDKEIRTTWSEDSRIKARMAVENDMRSNPRTNDEETIRQRLWTEFNKVPGKFTTQAGKYVKSYGSKWHRAKSKAMRDLKFTYQQWQDIYKTIDDRKRYFTVDRSVEIYKRVERKINEAKTKLALEIVHKELLSLVQGMSKDHRQRVWRLYGIKAKQRGMYGERRSTIGFGDLSGM